MDGLVASWGPDESFLVTTPNATFIPEIIQGIITVYLRDDGSFGKHDPAQWPQIFATAYPFLATIPKRPQPDDTSPCPHAAIWNHPTPDDFVPLPSSPGFGLLQPQFLDPLQPIIKNMSADVHRYVIPDSAVAGPGLRRYELEMSMAWQRLRHTAASFRDQMLQAAILRRYWLLCSGFMRFYDLLACDHSTAPLPVNRNLMGAWTSDPRVAQMLFYIGVPVWLVRPSHFLSSETRVSKFVGMASTAALCQVKFHGTERAYQGLASPEHLEITFLSHGELMYLWGGSSDPSRYQDLSTVPTPIIADPDDYVPYSPKEPSAPAGSSRPAGGLSSSTISRARYRPLPCTYLVLAVKRDGNLRESNNSDDRAARDRGNKAHPSQIRGRDKFVDVVHAWMPLPLPSWKRAMQAVDRSDKARPGRWGYWIPEPALLLGPKNPERMQKYVMNWLRARPIWLYMLQLPGSMASRHRTQIWRDFLYGLPDDPTWHTKNGKRAFEVKQIFARVFAEKALGSAVSGEVEWLGRRFDVVDERTGPLILWEAFELGFRYELSALDHTMRSADSRVQEKDRVALLARVFPTDSLYSVLRLPASDTPSLFAALPHLRIPSLNALRDVLLQWPLCPEKIKNCQPLQICDSVEAIHELELHLAAFYTQMFFDVAGRAPLVPHLCPPVL